MTTRLRIAQSVGVLSASVLGMTLSGSAYAGLLSTEVNTSDPFQAEMDFLGVQTIAASQATEDFEAISAGAKTNSLATDVGTFDASGTPGDTSGACLNGCTDLYVLNDATSPFKGRYDVTDGNGDDSGDGHWLDSNDVTEITWTPATDGAADAFGFYVMDMADVGAAFTITFDDQSTETVTTLDNQDGGTLAYVSVIADMPISSAQVLLANTSGNTDGDGFGIDDVTTAKVPQPSSLAILGLGLVGMGLGMRQRRRIER